ncbi:uncharacterized protein [Bemisia tabaci]|uniref:uncharacterized protein isoform X2 n=1 Tax=Bemisia tabaci TaxID=7038 RepID=UPI003B28CE9D
MSNPPAANNQQLAPGHGTSPLHVINYPLTPIFNQTSPGPSQLPPVRQTLRLEGMDFWKNHLLYAFEAACAGKSMEDIAVIATAAAATVAREAIQPTWRHFSERSGIRGATHGRHEATICEAPVRAQ